MINRGALVLTAAIGIAGCRDTPAPATAEAGLVATDSLARFPTVALDSAGTAYVAWVSSAGGTTDVFLTSMVDGVAGAAVRVNDRPGDAATHAQAPAQVAVASDGKVYVAWITQQDVPGRRFPASDLRLARSDDGGRTFAPAVTVNDDGGFVSGHHFHDLGVGPDGVVYVSWLDSREKDAFRAAGGAEAPAHDGHHDHDHAPHGDASQEPGTEVRIARSFDGGRTFGASTVIASGSCECCRTRLAFGPDGAVYVAWRHQFGANVRDPAIARSDDGGRSFTAPVRVHPDGWLLEGCPHSGPSLAIDSRGRVHLAWYTGAEGRAGLYHAVSTDRGATFSGPAPIVTDLPGTTTALASDGAGGVWLAWEDRQTRTTHVTHVDPRRPIDATGVTVAGAAPALPALTTTPLLARVDGGRVVFGAVGGR